MVQCLIPADFWIIIRENRFIKTMQPIILARVAHALAYTNILSDIGAPVERELQRAGLPTLLDSQPDAYIPVLCVFKFIQRMEYKEGIDDIGFLASRQTIFTSLSEDFILMSQCAPTLYARLQLFCELAPLENTHCRVSLSREGNDIRICNNLIGYPDRDGLRYSEWIQIIVLVEIIRKTIKPGWCPSEITFQSQFFPCDSAFEQFPDTRFLFGQKDTSIKVPISLTSQPLSVHQGNQGLDKSLLSGQQLPARAVLDFPGSLKLALRSYFQEGYPDIRLAAEIAGSSVRTLQRQLAQFGLSYSHLVQQTRFEMAVEMLKDQEKKSLDVAQALGYEDPSNFARAFRRIAGISPREYQLHQRTEQG